VFRNQGGSKWRQKALLFAVSAGLAAVTAGAALGLLGQVVADELRRSIAAVLIPLGAILGGAELLGYRVSLLQCDRETPQAWLHSGPRKWAWRNGVALGCGARNRLGFWGWYAVPLMSFFFADPLAGCATYGAYGVTRGVAPSILIWFTGIRHIPHDELANWLLNRYRIARRVAGAELAAVATLALLLAA
jgi:hypothetical protein